MSNSNAKKNVHAYTHWLGWMLVFSLISSADINTQKMNQLMQTRYGDAGIERLNNWHLLREQLKVADVNQQLNAVNLFFNTNIFYADDLTLWGKTDYWATPLDTLGKGAGDCEDFTIAKYFTLIQLGVPVSQLRLIYVKATLAGVDGNLSQAHMVLGYYPHPNAIPIILDNLVNEIELATQRKDLHPVFSFNSEGLWVGNQTRTDPTARLSRWRDLLARTQADGF